MKPIELCEPLFQYVCRVNRSARKQVVYAQGQVRAEAKAILSQIMKKAETDPALMAHFQTRQGNLYLVLLFFVDFMIRNSKLSFAHTWEDLAREEREYAGDEKFFDLLDEALADRGDSGADRIAVYYTCLGLGFSGINSDRPEYLRRKALECSARLRGYISADTASRICPKAYENVNTNDLIRPPSKNVMAIAILLVGLCGVLFVANRYMFRNSSESLEQKVRLILNP